MIALPRHSTLTRRLSPDATRFRSAGESAPGVVAGARGGRDSFLVPWAAPPASPRATRRETTCRMGNPAVRTASPEATFLAEGGLLDLVAEVGRGDEAGHRTRQRLKFDDHERVLADLRHRRRHVQRPLRAAAPLAAEEEPVDPRVALSPPGGVEMQVGG